METTVAEISKFQNYPRRLIGATITTDATVEASVLSIAPGDVYAGIRIKEENAAETNYYLTKTNRQDGEVMSWTYSNSKGGRIIVLND